MYIYACYFSSYGQPFYLRLDITLSLLASFFQFTKNNYCYMQAISKIFITKIFDYVILAQLIYNDIETVK